MEVVETEIPDVKVFTPRKFGDHRGFFSETYSKQALDELGVSLEFVQDNHSMSREPGVVRGLHFQVPPFAQNKLVRVLRGAIFDVAVDLRHGSPTFGKHVAQIISAEAWNQMLVPIGFAHGFCTLEPETEVYYKVTSNYAPEFDQGIYWNDPDIGITWPVDQAKAIISEKDAKQPRLRDVAGDLPF